MKFSVPLFSLSFLHTSLIFLIFKQNSLAVAALDYTISFTLPDCSRSCGTITTTITTHSLRTSLELSLCDS